MGRLLLKIKKELSRYYMWICTQLNIYVYVYLRMLALIIFEWISYFIVFQ